MDVLEPQAMTECSCPGPDDFVIVNMLTDDGEKLQRAAVACQEFLMRAKHGLSFSVGEPPVAPELKKRYRSE